MIVCPGRSWVQVQHQQQPCHGLMAGEEWEDWPPLFIWFVSWVRQVNISWLKLSPHHRVNYDWTSWSIWSFSIQCAMTCVCKIQRSLRQSEAIFGSIRRKMIEQCKISVFDLSHLYMAVFSQMKEGSSINLLQKGFSIIGSIKNTILRGSIRAAYR